MSKKILYFLISLLFVVNTACSTTETNNTNAVKSNANIPPEFSASPVPVDNGSIPGINPSNANNVPKGATPTPGIPDENTLGKPLPKGATPTPGIPDEKTRKEQMSNISGNSATNQKSSETGAKPNSPTDRSRTVNKP